MEKQRGVQDFDAGRFAEQGLAFASELEKKIRVHQIEQRRIVLAAAKIMLASDVLWDDTTTALNKEIEHCTRDLKSLEGEEEG